MLFQSETSLCRCRSELRCSHSHAFRNTSCSSRPLCSPAEKTTKRSEEKEHIMDLLLNFLKHNLGPFLTLSHPFFFIAHKGIEAFPVYLTLTKTNTSCFLHQQMPRNQREHLETNVVFTHLHFLCALNSKKQPHPQQQTYRSREVEEGQHSISS